VSAVSRTRSGSGGAGAPCTESPDPPVCQRVHSQVSIVRAGTPCALGDELARMHRARPDLALDTSQGQLFTTVDAGRERLVVDEHAPSQRNTCGTRLSAEDRQPIPSLKLGHPRRARGRWAQSGRAYRSRGRRTSPVPRASISASSLGRAFGFGHKVKRPPGWSGRAGRPGPASPVGRV